MRNLLFALAALAAGPAQAQAFSGLEKDVVAGFLTGIVEGCTVAAEANKRLDQLALPFLIPDPNRRQGFEPPAGSKSWAPKMAPGAVTIDEGVEWCTVATYGIPLIPTFDDVVAALQARGYELRPPAPEEPKKIIVNLAKKFERRAVVVSLSGTEGTTTHFSSAIALTSVANY